MIVVHVTHEAVEKIGGIGAVIAGLVTADAYAEKVSRTILLGPLLTTDRPVNLRLGEGGHVIYSSLDAVESPPWRKRFRPIEKTYDVGIIYGTRKIDEPCSGREVRAEVLLIDVFHSNKDRLNLFKAELFKKFAVPSDRFESIPSASVISIRSRSRQFQSVTQPCQACCLACLQGLDGATEHIVKVFEFVFLAQGPWLGIVPLDQLAEIVLHDKYGPANAVSDYGAPQPQGQRRNRGKDQGIEAKDDGNLPPSGSWLV